jgi:hypothetical protein
VHYHRKTSFHKDFALPTKALEYHKFFYTHQQTPINGNIQKKDSNLSSQTLVEQWLAMLSFAYYLPTIWYVV